MASQETNLLRVLFLEDVLKRLSKLAISAAIVALSISACSTTKTSSGPEATKNEINRAYGAVGHQSNAYALRVNGRAGTGVSVFRLYSENMRPNHFSSTAPFSSQNALVVDVGVDMQIEDSFPTYRIGIDPKKISAEQINMWPSHVLLESANGNLAARLPRERRTGQDGMIWSDWTYCADCFSLREIEASQPGAFSKLDTAQSAARATNGHGTTYAGQATFTSTPNLGILIGPAARDMAARASKIVRSASTGALPAPSAGRFEAPAPVSGAPLTALGEDLHSAPREIEDVASAALDRVVEAEVPVQAAPRPSSARIPTGDPENSTYYVARLLPEGAMMEVGEKDKGCITGLSCETGSIISLITVASYCEEVGGVTKTMAGWGVVAQRYRPKTAAEEVAILEGDGKSRIHVVSQADETALRAGIRDTQELRSDGDQMFFASYAKFYEKNAEEKSCKDAWRDAAKVKVVQNPQAMVE